MIEVARQRVDPNAHEVTCVIVAFHRADALASIVARLVAGGLHVVVVNVEADAEVRAEVERNGGRVVDIPGNPGYATAVYVSASGVQRIRTTAESHRRIAIIEVMGRHSGYIALGSGYGRPDIILVPESPLAHMYVMPCVVIATC